MQLDAMLAPPMCSGANGSTPQCRSCGFRNLQVGQGQRLSLAWRWASLQERQRWHSPHLLCLSVQAHDTNDTDDTNDTRLPPGSLLCHIDPAWKSNVRDAARPNEPNEMEPRQSAAAQFAELLFLDMRGLQESALFTEPTQAQRQCLCALPGHDAA